MPFRRFAALVAVVLAACGRPAGSPAPAPAPAGDTAAAAPARSAGADTLAAAALVRALGPTDPFPVDSAVRIDTLDNGLVYYIRRNAEPRERAELRLVVDAGSLRERPEERGLAHFLEHMLFNGTERFPGQELVRFLEGIGMQFGPHVNAYTSFDETVYMLRVPTDSGDALERAFDVLEDWATAATLDSAEIERERGVVIEEWRLRSQNAGGRILEQLLPELLPESRYAERLPIGDTAVIRHAPPERIRDFYRRWYRPDLMAVVAVGDFDPARVETLIRERFADLERPAEPVPPPPDSVPIREGTRYAVVTDPEQPTTGVSIFFRDSAVAERTRESYRRHLVGELVSAMLNQRFDEIRRRPDAPYVAAGASRSGFVRPIELQSVNAAVLDGRELDGLRALLVETERVRRHGFTAPELERAKAELRRAYQRVYLEREKLPSASYAEEYVRHYLQGEAIPGVAFEYALVEALLPEIGLEDVNREGATLMTRSNRLVAVIAPRKAGVTPPGEAQLAAAIAAVDTLAIEPYVDTVSTAPLVAEPPPPAEVVRRTTIPELDVTDVTLANGVRVLLKPTDFKKDQVLFTAFSPGGSSLVPDSAYPAALVSVALVASSGVGDFDATALEKKLAGTAVSVRPSLGELAEELSGSASPEDLETLFQLVYLYVTAPRADPGVLESIRRALQAQFENRAATPDGVFQDSLRAALYGNAIRRQPVRPEAIAGIDADSLLRLYRARFAEAGDFTFVFVGTFDVDRMIELARVWLGNLPTRGQPERWRNVAPDTPEGIVRKVAYKGQAPRSQVALVFAGPATVAEDDRLRLQVLEGVLDIRLREEIREARSGVYGVSVNAQLSTRPDSTYSVSIGFTCDPARVDELVDAVFAELEAIRRDGPSAEHVATAREQRRRERQEAERQNGFWLAAIAGALRNDEDPRRVLTYYERLAGVTPADVRDVARKYLAPDRYVRVVLYPDQGGAGGS